jgi:glycosyltransferase involved in cell wall biosynthesis
LTDESRKKLQSEYSWDAQKEKLLALYQDLLYPDVENATS